MIINFIREHWFSTSIELIVFILTFIQVMPIKLNPWSYIAKSIGRAINKEVIEKVENLQETVRLNKEADDEKWMNVKRQSILRFGDEIRLKENHSKEHFDQILNNINDYECYCLAHPNFKNNQAVATITLIKETYNKCLIKNDFL